MQLAFFVNDLATEQPNYTTTWLAAEALKLGHQVWYIAAGSFAYDPDDRLRAHAVALRKRDYKSNDELLADLTGEKPRCERLTVEELDVLMLRNDPSLDAAERSWACQAGAVFGQLAARRGVLVLNDPDGLSQAMNKLYFQQFPEQVRPATLITRDRDDIREFIAAQGGQAVLKPLQGSGGRNVFLVRKKEDQKNLNQMIETVTREGYVIVQEYLPGAEQGDIRLFLLNGVPFAHKGKFAAFLRKSKSGDMRSNMHAGGEAEPAAIGDDALAIAELVRPKLLQDGMFLVGLDIVGKKLMEINVFSPGGLYSVKRLTRVNFARLLIEDLERKVAFRAMYRTALTNRQLATM